MIPFDLSRRMFVGDVIRLDGSWVDASGFISYDHRGVGIVVSVRFKIETMPDNIEELIRVKWLNRFGPQVSEYDARYLVLYCREAKC